MVKGFKDVIHGLCPSTKRATGLPVVELVLWCGMFAPKWRLEWYHGLALHHNGTGLAHGAPF